MCTKRSKDAHPERLRRASASSGKMIYWWKKVGKSPILAPPYVDQPRLGDGCRQHHREASRLQGASVRARCANARCASIARKDVAAQEVIEETDDPGRGQESGGMGGRRGATERRRRRPWFGQHRDLFHR